MRIILASGSPRRKELLSLMGANFEVIISNADETINNEETSIGEQSEELAYRKAKDVFEKISGDKAVIGSDTLVVKQGKIYGKPKTKQEAFEMLNELKNDVHEVITSLCVLIEENGKVEKYLTHDIAKVYVNDMTEQEINQWIDSGEAMDKAGAYAIQGSFAVHIRKIDGNYHSIMGLPISKLYDVIKKYI